MIQFCHELTAYRPNRKIVFFLPSLSSFDMECFSYCLKNVPLLGECPVSLIQK